MAEPESLEVMVKTLDSQTRTFTVDAEVSVPKGFAAGKRMLRCHCWASGVAGYCSLLSSQSEGSFSLGGCTAGPLQVPQSIAKQRRVVGLVLWEIKARQLWPLQEGLPVQAAVFCG